MLRPPCQPTPAQAEVTALNPWAQQRRQLGLAAMGLAAEAALVRPALAQPAAPAAPARLPVRGIGVNCFDLFYGRLFSPGVAPPAQRLRPLADLGIPFVRFSASPVWPVEWQRFYRDRRARYFDLLDETVRAAETTGLKLVPTLFWYPAAVSDLLGEHVGDWAKPDSRCRAFMRQYVSEVVPRYAGSPAILAWEFANEFNAYANLPNATRWWPRVSVEMGTPAGRTDLDLITSTECSMVFRAFGAQVQTLHPQAHVSSGADLPLFNSESLLSGRSDPDSEGQFITALNRLSPDTCSMSSIHVYTDKVDRFRFQGDGVSIARLVDAYVQNCRRTQKLPFVGEFGVAQGPSVRRRREKFEEMLTVFANIHDMCAAVWVYDYSQQEGTWAITTKNENSWMLGAIAATNTAMARTKDRR